MREWGVNRFEFHLDGNSLVLCLPFFIFCSNRNLRTQMFSSLTYYYWPGE